MYVPRVPEPTVTIFFIGFNQTHSGENRSQIVLHLPINGCKLWPIYKLRTVDAAGIKSRWKIKQIESKWFYIVSLRCTANEFKFKWTLSRRCLNVEERDQHLFFSSVLACIEYINRAKYEFRILEHNCSSWTPDNAHFALNIRAFSQWLCLLFNARRSQIQMNSTVW